jgi:II/X family phage/plasmid replication protein
MIDRLVIRVPFRDEFVVTGTKPDTGILDPAHLLGTGLTLGAKNVVRDSDGSVRAEDLFHPFQSIPSWAAGMAIKTLTAPTNSWPNVEIKASPAKILAGHNVYGTEDFSLCAREMLGLLAVTFPALLEKIDIRNAYLASIDVTYSVRVESERVALEVIRYLKNVRGSYSSSRENYESTVYYGKKNSALKKLKIYAKSPELRHYVDQLEKKNSDGSLDEAIRINTDPDLIEFASGLIRFEATLKRKWLLRRAIPIGVMEFSNHAKKYYAETGKTIIENLHRDAFADITSKLKGAEMKIFDDEKIENLLKTTYATETKSGKISYSKAARIFYFFQTIAQLGWDRARLSAPSKTSFYRNVKLLTDAGIAIADLQNLQAIRNNAVPIVRFLDIEYANQRPKNWREPESQLRRLVAV